MSIIVYLYTLLVYESFPCAKETKIYYYRLALESNSVLHDFFLCRFHTGWLSMWIRYGKLDLFYFFIPIFIQFCCFNCKARFMQVRTLGTYVRIFYCQAVWFVISLQFGTKVVQKYLILWNWYWWWHLFFVLK